MQKNLYRVKANGYKYADVYVHCSGYDEAARKALNYLIEQQEEKDAKKPILDEDNSLIPFSFGKNTEQEEIKITSVEIITSHIIF